MDFTGAIGVDDLAFGTCARYLILNPRNIKRKFSRLSAGDDDDDEEEQQHDAVKDDDEEGGHHPEAARSMCNMKSEADDGVAQAHPDDIYGAMWDDAVMNASCDFETRIHCMICGSDCHSHVAVALNNMRYRGCWCWNKVVLAAWMFFCGKHTSWAAVVQSWGGFVIVATVWLFLHM